jgi:hypothetical protein
MTYIEEENMDANKRLMSVPLSVSFLFLPGCAGIGSGSVVRDRFDYTREIGDYRKQRMLIKTAELWYGDTTVFLDIASVIDQFLMFIFSLTETGGKEGAPFITVPAGVMAW